MRLSALLLSILFPLVALADDGHRLWLRQSLPTDITERIDTMMPDDDGYRITGHTIEARTPQGLLYGRYAVMRGEQGETHPAFRLRLLNHWDNIDGSIERGYAGGSIFWAKKGAPVWKEYAEALASVGINGTVLNNVNASPKMLTTAYLDSVRMIADVLRPWGVRVYLSVNFGSPKALGDLPTADPLDKRVQRWWQKKAKAIYRQIPDFGGFLVKANSEGQPGPFDYGRTHADGANMLADALAEACPAAEKGKGAGIVIWRSFVYGSKHKGEDRVKQAVSEFAELDGQFRENVILQSKNGPLDFQPREPYAPIFDNIRHTRQMAELQITQEYLGQGTHLVYLAPMWREFFSYVSPSRLVGVAGVANIGNDANWCGHHFAQANWYAFGRLAWNPTLSAEQIADEWLKLTFLSEELRVKSEEFATAGSEELKEMMLRSREACVDYMMPLGLHHIFKFDHHYGPEPDGFKAEYPIEWCPVYYHKADSAGIGFNRSSSGSNAVAQYREPYRTLYNDLSTCPEEYLLWFHHLPWTYTLRSGRTIIEELECRYARGVAEVEDFLRIWQEARPYIDEERWQHVNTKLEQQLHDAREWQQTCVGYFKSLRQ